MTPRVEEVITTLRAGGQLVRTRTVVEVWPRDTFHTSAILDRTAVHNGVVHCDLDPWSRAEEIQNDDDPQSLRRDLTMQVAMELCKLGFNVVHDIEL